MPISRNQHGYVQSWPQAEAGIGATFAFFVGIGTAVLAADYFYYGHHQGDFAWVCAALISVVVLEAIFLLVLARSLERPQFPFAPEFALKFRRWPLVFRPPVAAWWLAHFIFSIGMAIYYESTMFEYAVTLPERLLRTLMLIVVAFMIAYSANLYALLAVTAMGFGQRVVNALWRRRIVLDAALASAAVFAPSFWTWKSYQIAQVWFMRHF